MLSKTEDITFVTTAPLDNRRRIHYITGMGE